MHKLDGVVANLVQNPQNTLFPLPQKKSCQDFRSEEFQNIPHPPENENLDNLGDLGTFEF